MCSHFFFDFGRKYARERDRAVRGRRPKAKLIQLDVEALLECPGGTPVRLLQFTFLHELYELVVDVRADGVRFIRPVVEARSVLQADGDELHRAGLGHVARNLLLLGLHLRALLVCYGLVGC